MIMKRLSSIFLFLLCALCLGARPYPEGEIMTMGYLAFRDQAATEECFAKLAEAGIDMITLDMDQSSAMRQMDLAAQFGIKINAVVMDYAENYRRDPGHYTELDSLVMRIKDHPALFCYHIYDEPGLKLIPGLSFMKRHIEELDPEHPVYINLNPIGSMRALGTDYYPDYINTVARECDLKLLSYDCYPAYIDQMLDNWYWCQEVVSVCARSRGIPFWAFAATSWIDLESPIAVRARPTRENIRLQVNTNLAYGAQVIQYFTIRDFSGSSLAPFMADSVWTEAYYMLKDVNLEMKARQEVFAGCKVLATRFTGLQPFGTMPLVNADLPAAIASLDSDRSALVSIIENKGSLYVVVVSTSPDQATDVSVVFSSGVDMIDNAGNVISQAAGTRSFDLPAGDMLVFKCR